jgi:casein kinase 1
VKEAKVSIPVEILCEGLPGEFRRYFEYVRSLEFEEEPDYVWVKRLFRDLFEREGFSDNRVMDWAEKHQN